MALGEVYAVLKLLRGAHLYHLSPLRCLCQLFVASLQGDGSHGELVPAPLGEFPVSSLLVTLLPSSGRSFVTCVHMEVLMPGAGS